LKEEFSFPAHFS